MHYTYQPNWAVGIAFFTKPQFIRDNTNIIVDVIVLIFDFGSRDAGGFFDLIYVLMFVIFWCNNGGWF